MDAVEERFWSKVDRSDECWLWTAAVNTHGYGQFTLAGKQEQAHRVAYELAIGSIPDGLHIDHLCRVRACVNPAHLEAVTMNENTRRGVEARTHCSNGHAWTPENTRPRRDRGRFCLACHRNWQAAYLARQRAKSEGAR